MSIKVIWPDDFEERPKGDVLFASCDSVYFHDHAIPLIASANVAGNDIHVHVVNPVEHVFTEIHKVAHQTDNINVTFSYENTDLSLVDSRTYYASNRFMVAEQILQHADRLMIIDTDCLIMDTIEFPEGKTLGLFTRDSLPGTQGWEQRGTKVAAGIVLLTQETIPYIQGVAARVKEYGLRWFVDQVALYEQYLHDGFDKSDKFIDFSDMDMDWNFVAGSKIWTGKGERKYKNMTYVDKKRQFHMMVKLA
jgi:hypothetical protein